MWQHLKIWLLWLYYYLLNTSNSRQKKTFHCLAGSSNAVTVVPRKPLISQDFPMALPSPVGAGDRGEPGGPLGVLVALLLEQPQHRSCAWCWSAPLLTTRPTHFTLQANLPFFPPKSTRKSSNPLILKKLAVSYRKKLMCLVNLWIPCIRALSSGSFVSYAPLTPVIRWDCWAIVLW